MADHENDNDDNVLSLDTMLKRPKIKIDGAVHEMTSPGELTVEESYRLNQLSKTLANLRNSDGAPAAQQKMMSAKLNEIAEIILAPVPDKTRSTLTDNHKLAAMEVFTMLLQEERLRLAGATVSKVIAKYLGENPLPGSSGSTAEAPKAG
jgi:hypothetical protein